MTNYSAQYPVNGAPTEKTPQQRVEASNLRLIELQDKRYVNKEEPLDARLYSQKYEYDEKSYLAKPIFSDEQREAVKEMIASVNSDLMGFGDI